MSRESMFAIFSALLAISAIPIVVLGSVSAEISVETHRHTEGDWFEYEGYGLSLANSISNSQSANNSSGFVGWTLIYDEPLRIDVIERGTCDFGEWSGSCMRSEAKHHLNITLDWTTNATEFDDDKMILNITTTILHEEPLATSAWDREKRVVSISSWFLGDDELNLAETETTTTVTTHSSAERPEVMVVGDTWQATLEIHKEDMIRQRINRGMWNETTTSTDESRQIIYTVEDESLVHTAKLDWQALRLREQAVAEDNYSIVYLSELGWPVRTEEYESGVVVMSTVLTDFSSSQYDGPKVTTIEESPNLGIVATIALVVFAAVSSRTKSPTNDT